MRPAPSCLPAVRTHDPCVHFPDHGLFVPGPAAGPPGFRLVSAGGHAHPLRRVHDPTGWAVQVRSWCWPLVSQWLNEEADARRVPSDEPVAKFARCCAAIQRPVGMPGVERPAASPLADRSAGELRAAMPLPSLPDRPFLLAGGRFWRMGPAEPTAGRVRVTLGRAAWGLTGELTSAKVIDDAWADKLRPFASGLFATAQPVPTPDDEVALEREVRAAVARTGAARVGDLLYIDGPPPRIGRVMPPHYSIAFGRPVNDDLAVSLPLASVTASGTTLVGLQAMASHGGGVWHPVGYPAGLCLGHETPGTFPDPAAALLFVAIRVAKNGKFHERDGNPTPTDTENNS